MPALCAFGCSPSDVPMHRFPDPTKFPERFKTWVTLVGGKLETPSDYEYYKRKRICDKHFKDKDRNRNNRLNALAIPSPLLPEPQQPECDVGSNVLTQQTSNITKEPTCEQTTKLPEPHQPECDVGSNVLTQQTSNITKKPTCEQTTKLPEPQQPECDVGSSVLTQQTSNITKEPTCEQTTKLPGCQRVHKPSTSQQSDDVVVITQHCSKITESTTCVTENVPTSRTPDTSSKCVLAEHNYTAASKKKQMTKTNPVKSGYVCGQTRNMRTQIRNLRSEISRLRRKGQFAARVENATKLANNTVFQQVVQRLAKPAQLFLSMQLQGVKKAKGRRFTLEEKIMCLSLFKKGPKCYALLQKYFTLPSAKAMKRLLSKIKLTPGINPILFQKIKKTLSGKNTEDKLCSLAFDEMSLTAQVNFSSHKDTLEGFACNNEKEFANHALVFMVKGVKQNFKQPIAYYFTRQLNKNELKILIKTVIRHAQESGLIIINTVCDQSTVNVSAINELISDTRSKYLRQNKEWRHDCFTVQGHEIIPIFDAPHLIKGIRNNLLTKDMLYTTRGQEKRVKWEYFQQVYEADKSFGNLKLLHKITEEHVDPAKINKMRVKTATQIFSHSVAVVTEHLTGREKLPIECRDLIDITLLLDDLFDSLNVSSILIPDGKIYKGGIRNNSPHHNLWREAKKVLKTVKFISTEKTKNKVRFIESIVPSIKNLIRTIEGMEAIWNVLSRKYGLDVMLSRNFNQDPVENFFGNIRSYGVRNIAPNTIAFEGAYKALLLNNFISPHSKGANCEEDNNVCLQNLDFFIEENCLTPDLNPGIPEENVIINEEVFEPQVEQEDAGQRNYVCGWVLRKCLKQICKTCKHCRQTLIEKKNSDQNKYIKAKEYNNKKWLCYPSETTVNCFQEIQNLTNIFLRKNVPKQNVRKTITQFCDILINYPFTCNIHKIKLQKYFVKTTIDILIFSWCRTVNRILSGKITYEGDEEVKQKAAIYYNKFKNYKNKK